MPIAHGQIAAWRQKQSGRKPHEELTLVIFLGVIVCLMNLY